VRGQDELLDPRVRTQAIGDSDLLAGFVVVDWGTGKVTDVGDTAAGDGAYCDGCANSITSGLVYDVVLTPWRFHAGRDRRRRDAHPGRHSPSP
jgi:hypothetical protein